VTLCVYAVTVAGSTQLAAQGVGGERLRLVRQGSIAAVVGELARVPRPTPDNLRRYDAVMRRLAQRFPSILPARFGTSFDDPAELAFVLRSRHVSLRRELSRVRNRVQMTVRVVERGGSAAPNPPYMSGSVGRVPRSGPGVTGSDYLRGRAQASAREREIVGFDPVRDAVRRWVRDERVEKRANVASVYHLVPRTSAESYRAAAERAAAAAGLQVVITGPWPPYAFAGTW
jgi:hypothetical protein